MASGHLDDVEAGDLGDALARAVRGRSFVVIQAYVTPSGEHEGILRGSAARSATGSAWPHSSASARATCTRRGSCTRAAHGRASTCRCWRVTDSDAEIPGRPYGFRTVIEAQSRGDAQALRATGQPVARVTMAEVTDAVDAALGAG